MGTLATKVGRNDPCPCGSGAKYKKCCLPKEEAKRAAVGLDRVIERNGARLIVSPGVSDEQLALAAGYFEQKDRGEGPAEQMRRFVEPLLAQQPDNSPEGAQRLFTLGALFWNIALADEEDRQEPLAEAAKLFSEKGVAGFHELAAFMIRRHEAMFPELHERRAARQMGG